MHAPSLRVAGWLMIACHAFGQVNKAATTTKAPAGTAQTQITQGVTAAKLDRVAANRATVTIATTSADVGAKMKLFDSTLKEVTTHKAADGTIKADVDPSKGYVLAPPVPERRALSKDGLHFPARYLTFSATGATNLGGLFVRPAVIPLTWNDQTRAYATELLVGYEFEDGREITLPTPRTITFFAEGANAKIQASSVTVTKSGGPGYQRVVLTTGQTDGETHFTARASAVDELKSSVAVLREPGTLRLTLPSTELPAFGVGSAVLSVSLLARDGMPFAPQTPLGVQLSSRRLRQPAVLTLEAGKTEANVDVRTVGYGTDEIVAQSGALRATLLIKLVFPVAGTVAAIVGGGLGGVARYLRNKRRSGALLGRRVLEGALVGLILVAAAWSGLVAVDVSTGILGTPFGAFVLGALSGYLGCVVLDRVAGKTFGTLKDA